MKKINIFFRGITLLLFLLSMTTYGQTFPGSGGGTPITGGCFDNPITVSGLAAGATLTSVTINITHVWNADLDIYLVAPNGTQVELTSDNGGSGDNYTDTVFSDSASTPITSGSSPFTGTYNPEQSLSTVAGQGNGDWQLRVCDDYASGDDGIFNSWSITFGAAPPPSYCNSVPTSTDGAGITNVILGSSNFPLPVDNSYEDLTASTVTFQQGLNANTQITFQTGYTYDTNIWIDFNDNTVFEASEQVFDGVSNSSNPTILDASFVMPANAPLGLHRMRIGTADTNQSTPNPCYNGSYGVTIDFTVNVSEPICTPAVIAGTTIVPDCDNFQYYVDVDITNANDAVSISDGTNTWTIAEAGITTAGPFNASTSVNLTVVHNEEVCNINLDTFIYNCPPANNDCDGATEVFCGSIATGTTEFATSEVLDCDGFTLSATGGIWHSMIGTGGDIHLSTADSAFDTKLAVFSGSCGALVCVASDDDDGPGTTSDLTFSSNAGENYLIYITGFFSSSVGNYTLTVDCICEASMVSGDCQTVYSGYAPLASTELTATGQFGLAPYTFEWSDGQVGETITVTPTATTVYEVTVTDDAGCTSTLQTTVLLTDVSCGNNNQNKVTMCHNGDEICISPNAVQAHLNHGDTIGSCNVIVSCDTPPLCDSRLKVPGPDAIDVPLDIEISWGAATGYVIGYYLSVGTTLNGGEIIDNEEVGNNLSYDLSGLLDFGTTYYVSIVSYNDNGLGQQCESSNFTTVGAPWSTGTSIACGDALTGNTLNGTINDYLSYCGSTINDTEGVWYTFDGDGYEMTASLCTGTNFDTVIAIFEGDNTAISCVGGNDDFCSSFGPSEYTFTTTANQTYYVFVTAFSDSTSNPGPFTLSLSCAGPPPALQACEDALGIACNTTTSGSTVGYSNNPELGTCGTSLGSAPGRFYKMEGTGSDITVSTCNDANFDTKLGVFSGDCSALTCVAGNDDGSGCSGFSSELTFSSQSGTVYYIYVTGYLSNSGEFNLTVSCADGAIVTDDVSNESETTSWRMFPNPATNGEVELDLTRYLNKDLEIQMLDYSGKLLINKAESNLQNPRYKMKTKNVSNGLYFVRIVTDSEVSIKKLIIAN